MKKKTLIILVVLAYSLILSSCMKDERNQAKQVVQDFFEAVKNNEETKYFSLMPFLQTIDAVQQDALLAFLKEIVSEEYVISVPDKKGSVYTVTISILGPEESTVHYSFEVKKEDTNTWIIMDKVTQKITYDSFTL